MSHNGRPGLPAAARPAQSMGIREDTGGSCGGAARLLGMVFSAFAFEGDLK